VHRSETDGDLVAAALAGDRTRFAELVDRHLARATALAQRLLASRAEAEDIAQEATLQAYLGLRDLRDPARFGAWFCAIAANLARMRLRETRGRLVPLDGADGVEGEDALEASERLAAIHDALEGLTRSERETVVLHYMRGLTTPEIAVRRGEQAGTVRVRLHRARCRLQSVLAAFTPATRKERAVIEVDVRDVVVRVAPNGDGKEPSLAMPNRIVLLGEKGGERLLPIWIGAPEGDALGLHLAGVSTPRPMTIDFMARLLEAMGGKVQRVVVSSLRDDTFYAGVHLANDAAKELDARPSDGINLAVRVGAPIFVEESVFETAGFLASDKEALEVELTERCAKHGEEPPPGEWRTLTPDLMTSWVPPIGR
jgi:RNA polymerase sigma factor (sigma-70 family)